MLLGIAIFAIIIAWTSTKWAAVGTFTAIILAVGAGLPGYSIESAGVRTLFSHRNAMGVARYRDSAFCSITQNTTTITVRKYRK